MSEALSGDEYRMLAEKAPILIWRANLTMACDYFNETWLDFTGRALDRKSATAGRKASTPTTSRNA